MRQAYSNGFSCKYSLSYWLVITHTIVNDIRYQYNNSGNAVYCIYKVPTDKLLFIFVWKYSNFSQSAANGMWLDRCKNILIETSVKCLHSLFWTIFACLRLMTIWRYECMASHTAHFKWFISMDRTRSWKCTDTINGLTIDRKEMFIYTPFRMALHRFK